MNNEFLTQVLAAGGGVLLGIFFFGGLWWTIQKGLVSKYAGLWFLGSLFVRTGVLVAGFFFIADGHWQRLVACVMGFIIARLLVLKFQQKKGNSSLAKPLEITKT